MADVATLTAWLAAAEAARQAIALGRKTESIEVDGKRVTYTKVNLAELDNYIARLRRDIASPAGAMQSRVAYLRG